MVTGSLSLANTFTVVSAANYYVPGSYKFLVTYYTGALGSATNATTITPILPR